jgi:threonine aldolase
MKSIDFRSDTVTKPTESMRKAMAMAEVGDDVYGDDPTVNELEELAARTLGLESALFVTSGTMGNQIAIMSHTNRGDEILIGSGHHILNYEVGAMAVLSAVNVRTIHAPIVTSELILKNIRQDNIHFPKTTCVCLENALSNGTVVDFKTFQESIITAKNNNLNVHIDGARIFNAASALNIDVKDLIKGTDSIMFCLSKGLGAPVGSILAGSSSFIKKARKYRKMVGGGWRQAGIIAAAGIVAINEMIPRLHLDHKHAELLASKLDLIDEIEVQHDQRDINMVFFKFVCDIDDDKFITYLDNHQIKVNHSRNLEYRLLTHCDIEKEDILYLIETIHSFIKKNRE